MLLRDKLILTDCDGVLLEWTYGFRKWMKRHGYDCGNREIDTFDFQGIYGIGEDEFFRCITMFNESADIGWLPPLRDAVIYVKKIHEELGYVFTVITSQSTNPFAQKLRVQNLNRIFGENVFEDIIMITGKKNGELEPYRDSGCLWIEDKDKNYLLGEEMGLNSLLIRHRYNEELYRQEDTNSVYYWREIYESLRKHGSNTQAKWYGRK